MGWWPSPLSSLMDGVCAVCCLACLRRRMIRKTPRPMSKRTRAAMPMPIPALAPVESPSSSGLASSEAVAGADGTVDLVAAGGTYEAGGSLVAI